MDVWVKLWRTFAGHIDPWAVFGRGGGWGVGARRRAEGMARDWLVPGFYSGYCGGQVGHSAAGTVNAAERSSGWRARSLARLAAARVSWWVHSSSAWPVFGWCWWQQSGERRSGSSSGSGRGYRLGSLLREFCWGDCRNGVNPGGVRRVLLRLDTGGVQQPMATRVMPSRFCCS